eukprot:CAMPEP_0181224776 /NCGR_PEP_ID=MMETSP1096-20121128/31313_1 /TAXON_ID=156174 ORGANISM="Chrysochromulina ericina, Strain CCMP281" /NCGR_SAMPLE_ID=MMETSP1096 /ASSEMBLY_ACC=CAM_ASM_000453 /LENGTH=96 /DNA_ID=CAMNT_0023317893 /DNA_START=697 /DNA_END=987 /DNA_ORIENTATION=-
MGCLRDATEGLQQELKVSRALKARCRRILCSWDAAAIPTNSAVAEGAEDWTPTEYFSHAVCTVVTCTRAVCMVSGMCAHHRKKSRRVHVRLMAVAS